MALQLGQICDTWQISEILGADWYNVTCTKCGLQRKMRGYYLKRKPPECIECKKEKDIIGKTFGKLTVVEKLDKGFVKCRCECGNIKVVHRRYLQDGTTTSCGCNNIKKHYNMQNGLIDLTGKQFGDWTVLEYADNKKWLCRCSCGVERIVAGQDLRNGKSTGCGHNNNNILMDLTGKHFGEWEVIKYNNETHKWMCRCSCGKIAEVQSRLLRSGASKSCGHNTTGFKDLTGMTFGKWKVLYKSPLQLDKYSQTMWTCECQCENHTIRDIGSYTLRKGISKSCGCDSEDLRKLSNITKYGVPFVGQIGTKRTQEQIDIINDKNRLISFISKIGHKPSAAELGDYLGLDRTSIRLRIESYGLQDLILHGNDTVSGYEKWIESLFPCNHVSDRTVLKGKEIDLYYPEYNLGIEFNGNYWHSSIKKPSKYHQEKSILAAKNGVRLIHIFEYEWVNKDKRDKIIDILNMIMNKDDVQRIAARECEIKEVLDINVVKVFLNDNHLQGFAGASINIGLYYKNNLIGLMTFGKPRFNTEYQWELVRLAWSKNKAIIGGAEKLFRYFITKYNPDSIISYCDIAKFTGNVYKRLGFKLSHISVPNYVWINEDSNTVVKRYETMNKESIAVKYELEITRDTEGKIVDTESEMMEKVGFLKIYDAGNLVFVWNKPTEEK